MANRRFSRVPAGLQRGLKRQRYSQKRRGSAAVDYFLLLGVILPLAAFMMQIAPRLMRLVYDLLTVVVAWPFL